mmetsp:Transcript_10305/g.19477  ORF Transcript_10305/g.19477 Transcript_10305/m.19477 type:complete len:589 (+) Transcript_10305:44-1810(+)
MLLRHFLFPVVVFGCSNLLVSKGASEDGSTQIAYNADSGSLYGSVGLYTASDHPEGKTRDIWDWDASTFLGTIPEVNHTYNVVGNVNEHGLIIGETTFGGLPQLDGHGTGAVIDYGSLIWVTLQRAKTAREAIAVMDHLTQTYGYASDGESFSIADPNEVWLMEMMSKGKYAKGSVWVASRVPDGYICAHANQARTRTFAQDDPDNVLFSKDVVTFAQQIGLYPASAKKEDFSFSDVFDPVSFTGARLAEARVWNLFQLLTPAGAMDSYLDYAQGYNLTNRMPLFVRPEALMSLNTTMWAMRNHGEDTWFDNRGMTRPDVGAGSGNSAYRWRPLVWKSQDKSYCNERTVGVQQTAWNFVAQSRSWLTPPLTALLWFAPDDSSTGVRVPIYGGATRISPGFGDPVGQDPAAAVAYGVQSDVYNMNMDSAFWVYNLVANQAYGTRYRDVFPLITAAIREHEARFFAQTAKIDVEGSALVKAGKTAAAVELVTNFSVTTGDDMIKEWRQFWMFLFSRFRDGFTTTPATMPQCKGGNKKGCTSRLTPAVAASGYSQDWYGRISEEPGNHYAVPDSATLDERKMAAFDKERRK